MHINTDIRISWESPVESDPEWVKRMTCTLKGHKWRRFETFTLNGRLCKHCGEKQLFND